MKNKNNSILGEDDRGLFSKVIKELTWFETKI